LERHVSLFGILAALWGGLAVVAGASLLLLAGGAASELLDPLGANVEFAAGLTAGIFAVAGVFALLWGAVHVWAAALLQQRRPYGRVLALALAVINLVILPFGTALGIYGLWVLLTDEGRRLFEPAK
jgi:hypothetical protein